jgi:O-antigen/teichoic acid export membrane protein
MSEKRRIITNTLANGSAQATALIASLVFMPLLIRSFGITYYGLYLIVTSVAQYAQLLDFGVGASLIKMIAQHIAEDDRDGIGPLVSAALVFYLIIGVVAAILMVVLAYTAGMIFKVDAQGALLLRNMFLVAAVYSLFVWPANTFLYVLGGFQRYTLTARVQLGVTIALVGAYIAVLGTHQGPLMLFVATSIVTMAGSGVNVYFALREMRGTRISPTLAEATHLQRIFSFSWAIFLVQVSTIILYQQTDRVVLGVFIGGAAVGVYEAAGKFQGLITQLVSFSNSAVIPMASHLDASGAEEKLKLLFLRGTKYVLALVAPVVIVLMVLAKPLLVRWLGPSFGAMATNAQILVFPHLLIAGGTIGDSIIVGTGALKRRLPYSMAMVVANLVLSVILVQRYGILGVVLGTAIPYLIDYPIHIWWLLRELKVPAGRWWREVVAPVYPLLVIPLGVSVWGYFSPLSGSLIGLATIGAASVAAYLAGLFAVGLSAVERTEIRAAVDSVRARLAR